MKNKKVTLIVAVATLVSSVSIAGYNKHQQAVFTAANPLFEENIEAIADDGILGNFLTLLFGDSEKKEQEARDQYHEMYPCIEFGQKLVGTQCQSSGSSSNETNDHSSYGYGGTINGGVSTGAIWDANGSVTGEYNKSTDTYESNKSSYSGQMEYDCEKDNNPDSKCDRMAAVKCDGSCRYPSDCCNK